MPVPDADDEWFEQLRDAVVSGAVPPKPPAQSVADNGDRGEGRDRADSGDSEAGLAAIVDAVRTLGARIATVESLVEDIAMVVRRASAGPRAGDLEVMITTVLRAELPALLEQVLEQRQEELVARLAADRKALIDDAVREIRTLLFGQ